MAKYCPRYILVTLGHPPSIQILVIPPNLSWKCSSVAGTQELKHHSEWDRTERAGRRQRVKVKVMQAEADPKKSAEADPHRPQRPREGH